MIGAVIILLVTISVGMVCYVYDLKWRKKHNTGGMTTEDSRQGEEADTAEKGEEESHGTICCGRHLVCEKSLSPMPGDKIEYFDDEELDRYAGRPGDSYIEPEIEEFREVMETMPEGELAAWVRSLQLRNIELPYSLRDTLFLLLDE